MASLLAANERLSEFFSLAYPRGVQYAAEGFVPEVDSKLNERIYHHTASGISVWQDALDMSGGAAEKTALFYYVDSESFANIAFLPSMVDEVSLLFGEGIFASTKGPEEFGSREAVLWNNYWSQLQEDDETGLARSDPRHRLNEWSSFIDFCIPVIASKEEALQAQWTDEGQQSRDVWAIRLSDAKQRSYTAKECLLEFRRQRCHHCQAKFGADHPETFNAKISVARNLALAGSIAEAGDLFAEVFAGRERVFGPEHQDTLSVKNNFAYTLGERGDLVESERLLLEVLALSERTLGSDHPDTIRVKRNLNKIRAKRSQVEPVQMKPDLGASRGKQQKKKGCEIQ